MKKERKSWVGGRRLNVVPSTLSQDHATKDDRAKTDMGRRIDEILERD